MLFLLMTSKEYAFFPCSWGATISLKSQIKCQTKASEEQEGGTIKNSERKSSSLLFCSLSKLWNSCYKIIWALFILVIVPKSSTELFGKLRHSSVDAGLYQFHWFSIRGVKSQGKKTWLQNSILNKNKPIIFKVQLSWCARHLLLTCDFLSHLLWCCID